MTHATHNSSIVWNFMKPLKPRAHRKSMMQNDGTFFERKYVQPNSTFYICSWSLPSHVLINISIKPTHARSRVRVEWRKRSRVISPKNGGDLLVDYVAHYCTMGVASWSPPETADYDFLTWNDLAILNVDLRFEATNSKIFFSIISPGQYYWHASCTRTIFFELKS